MSNSKLPIDDASIQITVISPSIEEYPFSIKTKDKGKYQLTNPLMIESIHDVVNQTKLWLDGVFAYSHSMAKKDWLFSEVFRIHWAKVYYS
jgi:hypothetical protein